MATANIFCIKLKTLIFPQVLEYQNITIKKFNNAVFCKLDSSTTLKYREHFLDYCI